MIQPSLIRDATAQDEASWRLLWLGFLDFYGQDLDPAITAHTWARLMDPAHPMSMRVAVKDDAMVGFAIHIHHASTWVMGDDCYLEDLFVAPSARDTGIGRALIDDLISLARKNGWHRLYWHTDEGNATARKLYDSYLSPDGHIRYRMALR